MQIDSVILELRADLGRYRAELKNTTSLVDSSLLRQENRVRSLERQMERSSGAISGSLRRLAGIFATYFTGRELVGMLDTFTRLQNNLRVAGVEGDQLKAVQDRLFASAQKYGVELESLSSLFSTLSQASKELGASQEQVFGITDAVSASLKITGLSANEAQGALLQLGQALRGGKVQAEEYNSLLDGLYPLLEAAAAGSERWGGSVAKLTADVKAGTVASKEFSDAILAGSEILDSQASKATLTLSSGLTTLANALTIYFGAADKANGVSAALGEAIGVLADNLGTLIPILAAVGVGLGVGFAVNAARATIAANALIAAEIGVAGAAGTIGVTMGNAGRAMLAAFGGPVGVAILAVASALAYATVRNQQLTAATERYTAAQSRASASRAEAESLSQKLANATGKERRATELAIAATLKQARANQIVAVSSIRRAQAELAVARALAASAKTNGGRYSGAIDESTAQGVKQATANLAVQTAALNDLNATVKILSEPIKLPALPSVGGGDGKGAKTPKGGGAAAPSGRSAANIARETAQNEARYQDELAKINADILSEKARNRDDIVAIRDAQLAQIEAERAAYARSVKLDEGLTEVKRATLIAAQNVLLDERALQAEVEYQRAEADRKAALDRADLELAIEQVSLKAELAGSTRERRDAELELLDLSDRLRLAEIDRILATEEIASIAYQQALDDKRALEATRAARAEIVRLRNLSARERYVKELNRGSEAIAEDLDKLAIDGLKQLNDELVDAILNSKSLGDVFKNVANSIIKDLLRIAIQQAVIKPLANALFGGSDSGFGGGGGGGGLGALGTIFNGLFGRASGGAVSAGQIYRVNEGAGAGRVEGFVPAQSGHVIPLGRMNVAPTPSLTAGGQINVNVSLSEDLNARIDNRALGVAVEVTRQAAPQIASASSAQTIRQLQRPRT